MRADRYSRTVALLKVLLPLAALSILSTLFLLSRTINPEQSIPFADSEVQDRLRDQQITGPFFSGTTADGDELALTAEKITTPEGATGINQAENVTLNAIRTSGLKLSVQAKMVQLDMTRNRAALSGDVILTTSSGYVVKTDRLNSRLSSLDLAAPKGVTATGPLGKLTAQEMKLSAPSGDGTAQLLFTQGVKLVYEPK